MGLLVARLVRDTDGGLDCNVSEKPHLLLPTLPPQPSVLLPRLTLVASELIHVLEREPSVGKSKPLLDDLRIEEGAVF